MSTALVVSSNQDYDDNALSIPELRRHFTSFLSAKGAEIEERVEADRFYHGKQWTEKQVRDLDERKQLATIYNLVAEKINTIVGVVNRLKMDPKAYPTSPNPRKEDGAMLATQIIRHVLDCNEFAYKDTLFTLNLATKGISGYEMMLKPSKFGDYDIDLELVNPSFFFYDPRSEKLDFSDASFMGVAKWMDIEDIKADYPEKADLLTGITDTGNEYNIDQTGQGQRWTSNELKQAIVVDHWYRTAGGWNYCVFAGNVKLAEGASPFIDDDGKEICKYRMCRAFIDDELNTYSLFRKLKWAQIKYNHRDSKALWLLNARRIKAERGAFQSPEKARKEAARPDGFLEFEKGFNVEFEDAKNLQDMTAQLKFLEMAKAEIDSVGPNPALLGDLNNKSGRAIQMLQQAGLMSLGPFLLAIQAFKKRLYRTLWPNICQYMGAERWVRVTDDENVMQFIPINQRVQNEFGQFHMVNAIAELDVDILIDEATDTVNTMMDTLELLQTALQSGVPIPPNVIIELSPIDARTKKKLLGMMEQASQPTPEQQQAQQVELEGKAAEIEDKRASAQHKQAMAAKTTLDMHMAPLQAGMQMGMAGVQNASAA